MNPPAPISRRNFFAKTALAAGGVAAAPAWLAAQSSAAAAAPAPAAAAAAVTTTPEVTRLVARWLLSSRPENIPAAVQVEAVRSIVNWIGVAVGGSHHETVDIAVATLQPYSGPPKASLFGRSERFDPLRGALINGISSHVLDFDDTHLKTIIHPAGPVAAALFALAEDRKISGAEFVHAFILGTEVECRLGNAIFPSHYEMGWHITGTCGVFGAAAAVGKILGLNEQQMLWALGTAATQSSGLKIMFGTMCKSFHPGRAAENGLLAALLAAKGFTSSEQSMEGKEGYIYAASREHNYDELTKGLGEHYEISLNTYKPFACGIVILPTIDGMLQFRANDKLNPADVETIAIRANPQVLKLTGKKTPQTGLEGKFSVYHSAAVALVRGYAGMKEYTDEVVRDPQIIALRDRVQVSVDPSVHEDEVFLTVTTKDGRKLEKHVEHAIGSLGKPMKTNADLEFKFLQLADGVLPKAQAEKLLKSAWGIETMTDAGALVKEGARSA